MRRFLAAYAALLAALAVAGAVTMTAAYHHKPVHRTFSCQFAKDYHRELHLPPPTPHC